MLYLCNEILAAPLIMNPPLRICIFAPGELCASESSAEQAPWIPFALENSHYCVAMSGKTLAGIGQLCKGGQSSRFKRESPLNKTS